MIYHSQQSRMCRTSPLEPLWLWIGLLVSNLADIYLHVTVTSIQLVARRSCIFMRNEWPLHQATYTCLSIYRRIKVRWHSTDFITISICFSLQSITPLSSGRNMSIYWANIGVKSICWYLPLHRYPLSECRHRASSWSRSWPPYPGLAPAP